MNCSNCGSFKFYEKDFRWFCCECNIISEEATKYYRETTVKVIYKDAFDNTLNVGDDLVCLRTTKGYKARADNALHRATVIGFSKQKIRVKYDEDDYVTTRYSNQVCKYIEPKWVVDE